MPAGQAWVGGSFRWPMTVPRRSFHAKPEAIKDWQAHGCLRSWRPFDGETVETLFQMIERHLQDPGERRGGRIIRDVVGAVYDKRLGYPTHISIGPPASEHVMDANVSYTVELMESPAAPLIAPSPGEAYQSPVPGRLLDPLDGYRSLFGFGSDATARIVRRVWPGRADEIISRGASPHWESVGWTPKAGLVGNIIGTLTLASGVPVYVMEFTHGRGTVFLLIEKQSVQVIRRSPGAAVFTRSRPGSPSASRPSRPSRTDIP